MTQPGSEEIRAPTWCLPTIIEQISYKTGTWCLKITKDDKIHAFAMFWMNTGIRDNDSKTFMIYTSAND